MEGKETQEEATTTVTFWLRDGELRTGWKLLSFIAVFFFSLIVYSILFYFLPLGVFAPYSYVFSMLAASCTATYFAYGGIERKPFLDVGLHRPYCVSGTVSGAMYGSALLAAGAVILILIPAVYLESATVTGTNAVWIVAEGMLFFLLAAVAEEILMRGYAFQLLLRRYGYTPALIATSVFFSVIHIANPNVTFMSLANIFLAGLLLGSAYLATGSLWFPIGVHMGWNFIQGSVLGFPVSGIVRESVFVAIPLGADEISGGLFGLEGSIIASAVLLFGSAVLWLPSVVRSLPGNPVPGFGVSRKETET